MLNHFGKNSLIVSTNNIFTGIKNLKNRKKQLIKISFITFVADQMLFD